MKSLQIGRRVIGPGHPCFVIAEMSGNHNQSLDRAIEIVRAAHGAGADAIKLQTYTADTLTIDSDQPWFQVTGGPWKGYSLHHLYSEAFTPWEWHAPIQQAAAELGLEFFSTPFDHSAVDFLERHGVPAYKVASFEVVDLPLLRRVAETGKPVILSTGMASLGEIQEALETLRTHGAGPVALLKCTSAYPAPADEMNLRTIPNLAETFGAVAGLSDHTLGYAAAVAAVALGGALIEKHLTLARSDGGHDSAFSLEPGEFASMVRAIRVAEAALGTVSYARTSHEQDSVCFRRSLFVIKNVSTGEIFTSDNVRSIRPGFGLAPRHWDEVLGKRATRDIVRGTPLAWDMIHRQKPEA
jgi:pseudaminic acid synthase